MLNIQRLLSLIVKKNGHRKYKVDREWMDSFRKLQEKSKVKKIINYAGNNRPFGN